MEGFNPSNVDNVMSERELAPLKQLLVDRWRLKPTEKLFQVELQLARWATAQSNQPIPIHGEKLEDAYRKAEKALLDANYELLQATGGILSAESVFSNTLILEYLQANEISLVPFEKNFIQQRRTLYANHWTHNYRVSRANLEKAAETSEVCKLILAARIASREYKFYWDMYKNTYRKNSITAVLDTTNNLVGSITSKKYNLSVPQLADYITPPEGKLYIKLGLKSIMFYVLANMLEDHELWKVYEADKSYKELAKFLLDDFDAEPDDFILQGVKDDLFESQFKLYTRKTPSTFRPLRDLGKYHRKADLFERILNVRNRAETFMDLIFCEDTPSEDTVQHYDWTPFGRYIPVVDRQAIRSSTGDRRLVGNREFVNYVTATEADMYKFMISHFLDKGYKVKFSYLGYVVIEVDKEDYEINWEYLSQDLFELTDSLTPAGWKSPILSYSVYENGQTIKKDKDARQSAWIDLNTQEVRIKALEQDEANSQEYDFIEDEALEAPNEPNE